MSRHVASYLHAVHLRDTDRIHYDRQGQDRRRRTHDGRHRRLAARSAERRSGQSPHNRSPPSRPRPTPLRFVEIWATGSPSAAPSPISHRRTSASRASSAYLGVIATDHCTPRCPPGRSLTCGHLRFGGTDVQPQPRSHARTGRRGLPAVQQPRAPAVRQGHWRRRLRRREHGRASSSVYWHQLPKGQVNPVEVDSLVTIYPDPTWRPARPSAELAAGFVTAPVFGMEAKVEARESWLLLTQVTGPTPYQGVTPPTRAAFSRFLSVLAGFDIVFARRRGRRY